MEQQAPVGLLTDRYELTMLSSFVEDGSVHRQAVFECFARRLPSGRRYGVVAGLGRLVELLDGLHFDDAALAWLDDGVITPATADYLRDVPVQLRHRGLPRGRDLLPRLPGPDRTRRARPGADPRDAGAVGAQPRQRDRLGRGPHGRRGAGAAADRDGLAAHARAGRRRDGPAAYLAGFDATSNLAAGLLYGIPTVGTAAHAFTLAHRTEKDAFASQVATHGPGTTLLVDTYDIEQGIRTAVEVAGPELGAIRIDSGDLAEEARRARTLLDSLGATSTRITVTSDLDEYLIAALADAPVDAYGVGSRVATGSGHPAAGMVYKLVAVADDDEPGAPMRPVAKTAEGKVSLGGRKTAYRELDDRWSSQPRGRRRARCGRCRHREVAGAPGRRYARRRDRAPPRPERPVRHHRAATGRAGTGRARDRRRRGSPDGGVRSREEREPDEQRVLDRRRAERLRDRVTARSRGCRGCGGDQRPPPRPPGPLLRRGGVPGLARRGPATTAATSPTTAPNPTSWARGRATASPG